MRDKVGLDDFIRNNGATAADVEELPRVSPDSLRTGVAEKRSQAQRLVDLVHDEALFRSTDGETAFATIPVRDHQETWPIRSKGFRRWLVGQFYQTADRPPSAQALADALGTLEARAQFGGRIHEVHVRVAKHEGAIYFDLADENWRAVAVTRTGWRVVADPPVKFRRARGMQALPSPIPGGNVDELKTFVNVKSEDQFALIKAWLVAALRPTGPYPVLAFIGEHGSAKSTNEEICRALIDPNVAMLRAEPSSPRDVMIAASNSWMIALDNLTDLDPWLSDCLCRLATGGGFSTRELYTDGDEIIFDAERPVMLNGIDAVIRRPDLLDRAMILDLPRIPDGGRRRRDELWRAFETSRPRLLGALLTAASAALGREPYVRLDSLPRMADFATWVVAAEPALGLRPGQFLASYDGSRAAAHDLALEASPIAAPIQGLADQGDWSGTATELLEALSGLTPETQRRAKGWPTTAPALSAALRSIAPNLRAVGIGVEFSNQPKLGPRRRQIAVQKVPVSDRSERSDRSGVDPGPPPPFSRNDDRNGDYPRQNAQNGENTAGHVLSDTDEEVL
jgi:hypothetical protein